jgi:2-succinyl-5-enolpyruvyl-6-hydroxy-3-cyclohexene-1-carboxylate synthase
MANEAMLELTHRVCGPVQLNIPAIDGEWQKFTVPTLPEVRTIRRYMEWDKWDVSLDNKKIMLVIGEHRPFTEKQKSVIEAFCVSYNAFIYVNHLSNYHGKYAVYANLSLTGMDNAIFNKKYRPDLLITIGGQTGDYSIFGKLSSGNEFDFEHWRISEDGNVVDTYDKLTKIFECPHEIFFTHFITDNQVEHDYYELWRDLQNKQIIPDELPFSNAYLAQQLHALLPANSYLNLAILNSLRIWNFFPLNPAITCYSNVSAFGIDGCMSVLLGQSVATPDKLCFLVIGDLSFFYDMNSLGIRHLKNNIRILLVNNNGGTEFKLYYQPFKDECDAYTAAVGHNSDAKGWAEANGFTYFNASTMDEFLLYKENFVAYSDKPVVFEVFTNHRDESDALRLIIENNKETDNSLSAKIKKSIPPEIKKTIKAIIGKK